MKRGKSYASDHAAVCASILGVMLPISSEALKDAYRKAVHAAHPDHGGSPELFIQVKEAYDFLVTSSNGFVLVGEVDQRETIQGDKIADLGKGLGPRVNGRPCDTCHGRGYTSHPNPSKWGGNVLRVTCRSCDGAGEIELFNPVLRKMTLATGGR